MKMTFKWTVARGDASLPHGHSDPPPPRHTTRCPGNTRTGGRGPAAKRDVKNTVLDQRIRRSELWTRPDPGGPNAGQ
jgi:hypothetical protein